MSPAELDPDPQTLLPVVVGAHLRAELHDRPLGTRVLEAIRRWPDEGADGRSLEPIVCTDLWYLNAQDLMLRPTIAIGDPAVNAASALFANRLPTAFVMEDAFQVQLDPSFVSLQACLWGVDQPSTVAAVELFLDRYLDPFLRSARGLPLAP